MPRRPILVPNLMKPLRASRLKSSLRPSCKQTRTLDRDIQSKSCCLSCRKYADATLTETFGPLTLASEEKTVPVGCPSITGSPDRRLQAAHTGGLSFLILSSGL